MFTLIYDIVVQWKIKTQLEEWIYDVFLFNILKTFTFTPLRDFFYLEQTVKKKKKTSGPECSNLTLNTSFSEQSKR